MSIDKPAVKMASCRFLPAALIVLIIANVASYLYEREPSTIQSRGRIIGMRSHLSRLLQVFYTMEDPQIVLLGSSLVQLASNLADLKYQCPENATAWPLYADFIGSTYHARDFEQHLRSEFGQSIAAGNLAQPSSIIEDDALVLRKLLRFGKHPAIVIVGVAPRDFIVRMRTETHSPIYEGIDKFAPSWWSEKLSQQRLNCIDLWSMTANDWLADGREWIGKSMRTELGKVDGHVKTFLVKQFPSDSTPDSFKPFLCPQFKTPREYAEAPITLADLPDLKNFYCEKTRNYLMQQMAALDEMLGMANKADISVVVVKLPLAAAHKKVFDSWVLKDVYNNQLQSVCSKHSAPLFEPDHSGDWPDSCFHDSAHLNGKGGDRLFAMLAQMIRQDGRLAARLFPSFVAATNGTRKNDTQ
jgi:hypothetical protein